MLDNYRKIYDGIYLDGNKILLDINSGKRLINLSVFDVRFYNVASIYSSDNIDVLQCSVTKNVILIDKSSGNVYVFETYGVGIGLSLDTIQRYLGALKDVLTLYTARDKKSVLDLMLKAAYTLNTKDMVAYKNGNNLVYINLETLEYTTYSLNRVKTVSFGDFDYISLIELESGKLYYIKKPVCGLGACEIISNKELDVIIC